MTRTWDAAVVIHNKNTKVTKASTHATMILTLSYRASKGQRHTLDIPGSDGLVFRMEIPSREVFPRAALCHLHTAPAEVRIKSYFKPYWSANSVTSNHICETAVFPLPMAYTNPLAWNTNRQVNYYIQYYIVYNTVYNN